MPDTEVLERLMEKLHSVESVSSRSQHGPYIISPWKKEVYRDNRPSGVATNEKIKTPLK